MKKEGIPQADKAQYQRSVGKLVYLSHTRLDMAYLVSAICQSMTQEQGTYK